VAGHRSSGSRPRVSGSSQNSPMIKARGHFPSEQAALKCLYLVTRSLDPTGTGRARWAMRWKPALNAFAITFGDRFPAAETY
jgi:putative transposase